MAQRGAYARRNAGHKDRWARRYAAASGDREQLSAAYDWFRSAAELLARRRVPRDAGQEAHRAAAARLVRDMAAYLKATAEAIDRGDYDAKGS